MSYLCYVGIFIFKANIKSSHYVGFIITWGLKLDAAQATIQAAYIQGGLAVLAAFIGASALIYTLKKTTNDAVKLHKSDKLAESKRIQYIDFIEQFTLYIQCALKVDVRSYHPLVDSSDPWVPVINSYFSLMVSIDKVYLVAPTEIRAQLFELEKKIFNFHLKLQKFHFNTKPQPDIKNLNFTFFIFSKCLRKDLGIQDESELEQTLLRSKMIWDITNS